MEVSSPGFKPVESPVTRRLAEINLLRLTYPPESKPVNFQNAASRFLQDFSVITDLNLREDESKYFAELFCHHAAVKALRYLDTHRFPNAEIAYIESYKATLKNVSNDLLTPRLEPDEKDDREFRYLNSLNFAALELVNILFPRLEHEKSSFEDLDLVFNGHHKKDFRELKENYNLAKQPDTGERFGYKAYKLRIAEDRAKLGIPAPKESTTQAA